MDAEEVTQRVLAELRAQARRRRGQMTELEVAVLGRHRGYVSKVYSQERDCTTEELFEILDAMGIDAATHFGRALGALADPVGVLERLESYNDDEPLPATIQRLRRLRRAAEDRGAHENAAPARPPALSLERLLSESDERQLHFLEKDVELRKPGFITLLFDSLEELRHRRPGHVARICQTVASHLPGSELAILGEWRRLYCRALGILGSAYRQLGQLRAANQTLREALFCVEVWKKRREEAELLQQVCYLLVDYGEPEEALRVTELASQAYGDSRHLLGMVKVFVDRGHVLNRLGHTREAGKFFTEAIEHLPPSAARYRASAHIGLAQAAQGLGRLGEAEQALAQARELIDPGEPISMVALLYCEAELALAQDEPQRATDIYRQLRQIAATGSALDSALGSLALCKALLDVGEAAEARVIATEMVALLIPLEEERLSAAAALSDLIKAARTGKLSAELVEETRSKVQRAEPAPTKPAPLTSSVSRPVPPHRRRQRLDPRSDLPESLARARSSSGETR